jgi:hypothetical protein
MFPACLKPSGEPINRAGYRCFVPVVPSGPFCPNALSQRHASVIEHLPDVSHDSQSPRYTQTPMEETRSPLKREITKESVNNGQPRRRRTVHLLSRLTVGVESMPREEMFEILDSGRTGSGKCSNGDDTSARFARVDVGRVQSRS